MKKSLVALAVLAAAGAASAQSSVTLFGVVDTGVSYYTVKSSFYNSSLALLTAPVAPVGVKKSQWAMSQGGNSSNRVGFRGVEDLGGGLAASFWLEAGYDSSTGANAISSFNRRSTVSLSGGFGELRLGRDYTPTFTSDSAFDPYGTVGVGTNLVSTVNANLYSFKTTGSVAGSSDPYVRSSNSIGYFLPPNLGGFYGQVMYALHENVKSSDLAGSPSKRGKYIGGRFGYANGPLDVALAYGQTTVVDTTGAFAAGPFAGQANGVFAGEKIKQANLGASYDFGVAKVVGEYSRVTDSVRATVPFAGFGSFTTTDNDKYTGGLLGVIVPVGAGQIKASFSRVKFKNDLPGFIPSIFGPTNFDASANKIAIGYVHNLSKRTALYATAARIRIKDGQNNPAIMGATTGISGGSAAFLSTGGGVSGFAPRSATGYDFGLRHSF
jgi:predicted porin